MVPITNIQSQITRNFLICTSHSFFFITHMKIKNNNIHKSNNTYLIQALPFFNWQNHFFWVLFGGSKCCSSLPLHTLLLQTKSLQLYKNAIFNLKLYLFMLKSLKATNFLYINLNSLDWLSHVGSFITAVWMFNLMLSS